jgi:hypothetical protein
MRGIQRVEVAWLGPAWSVTLGMDAGDPKTASTPAADRLSRPVAPSKWVSEAAVGQFGLVLKERRGFSSEPALNGAEGAGIGNARAESSFPTRPHQRKLPPDVAAFAGGHRT